MTARLLSTAQAWQLSKSKLRGQSLYQITSTVIETDPMKDCVRMPQLDARPINVGFSNCKMCTMTPPNCQINPWNLLRCRSDFFMLQLSKSRRAAVRKSTMMSSSFTRAHGSFRFGAGSCHIFESLSCASAHHSAVSITSSSAWNPSLPPMLTGRMRVVH